MKVVLVTGGTIEERESLDFLETYAYDKLIGADRGCLFLRQHGFKPDLVVGDFDSLPKGVLETLDADTPIRRFLPQKDATDTEIGVRAAMEMGADEIAILGGIGTRMDHVLGNIQTLMIASRQGTEAFLADSHNRIRLLTKGRTLKKEHMFGNYVSFLPLTTSVQGLTLQGFRYPLKDYTLTSGNSLGVSNEVAEDEAQVQFQSGVLIMIESRD